MLPSLNSTANQNQNSPYLPWNNNSVNFTTSLKNQNIIDSDGFRHDTSGENDFLLSDNDLNVFYKNSLIDSDILLEIQSFHLDSNKSYWSNLMLPLAEKEYLLMTLRNLKYSLEFKDENIRQYYMLKVKSFLEDLEKDPFILYYILGIIDERYKNSYRKPLLCLYSLKFISMGYKAVDENWDLKKLLDMGKRIFRLVALHRLAQQDLLEIKNKVAKHNYYLKIKYPFNDSEFYLAYQVRAIEEGIELPIDIPKIYRGHFYVLEHKIQLMIDKLKTLDFYEKDGRLSKDFSSCISSFWTPLKDYVEINYNKSIEQMKK